MCSIITVLSIMLMVSCSILWFRAVCRHSLPRAPVTHAVISCHEVFRSTGCKPVKISAFIYKYVDSDLYVTYVILFTDLHVIQYLTYRSRCVSSKRRQMSS